MENKNIKGKGLTCFIVYVGYRNTICDRTSHGVTTMYVCSTEEKAQAKLKIALENVMDDLKTELKNKGGKLDEVNVYHSAKCIKVRYTKRMLDYEYNIFYNEFPMD